jgi:hypothetical protein
MHTYLETNQNSTLLRFNKVYYRYEFILTQYIDYADISMVLESCENIIEKSDSTFKEIQREASD